MRGIFCITALLLLFSSTTKASPPDSLNTTPYDSLLIRLDTLRLFHTRAYSTASRHQHDSVIDDARKAFISSVVDSIAPYWMGTPWDYNGTTRTPGTGSIACGYFVSTLLSDAGLKVQRVKMAQQASEKIVKTLALKDDIKRFRNTEFAHFVDSIESWGEGLYVVGLDYHVGFLYHDSRDLWFIHSTFVGPRCVLRELAGTSIVLASSKYRVVGKISENDGLIRKWLRGEKVQSVR